MLENSVKADPEQKVRQQEVGLRIQLTASALLLAVFMVPDQLQPENQ